MTSRERIRKALSREIPDRVPIDLGGNQTGIHKNAYRNLVRFLGLDEDIEIMDAVQQLARPSEAVLERFRVDSRYVAAAPAASWKGGIVQAVRDGRAWSDLTDEFGVRWSMPDDSPLYMDITVHPLAKARVPDLAEYPWPDGFDPSRFAGLRERAVELHRWTPFAVIGGISGVVYETCWYLRGLEQWYCDLLTDPAFCEALLDRVLDYWLDWFNPYLAEVGDLLDVVMVGDDLCGQNGPLFNPEIYRRLVRPRHRRLMDFIKSRTGAKIWYHTCGSCVDLIPDLIGNGVAALNPVQTTARNMDPLDLKSRFSRDIAFWGGGCDAQRILPTGTPGDVSAAVAAAMAAFKPGGGYVFAGIHNIQGEVPPENIVALFDAAYKHGFYS